MNLLIPPAPLITVLIPSHKHGDGFLDCPDKSDELYPAMNEMSRYVDYKVFENAVNWVTGSFIM